MMSRYLPWGKQSFGEDLMSKYRWRPNYYKFIPQICDSSRHLQECPGARAWKCPTECFLSNFGHLPRSAPKSAFWVLFGVFRPKKRQNALEKHSLGHSEAGAQNCSKSTPWGTFRPGPRGTPVNGGWNCKSGEFLSNGGHYTNFTSCPRKMFV